MKRRIGIFGAVLFVILAAASCSSPQENKITIRYHDHKAIALVINGAATKKEALIVRRSESDIDVAGVTVYEQGSWVFTPYIPLTPAFKYDVIFGTEVFGQIDIPYPSTGPPEVKNIYPSGDTIPENQMKIYILFSQPMREGQSVANVALLDENGHSVKGAFLDLQQELWNVDRTSLTLWLDPGRTKRGLKPNLALGAPLTKGKKYTVIVNSNWTNYLGQPLKQTYGKTYFTVKREDELLDPARWTIRIPKKGTLDSLVVNFQAPLDYYLLKRNIGIKDNTGNFVERVKFPAGERSVTFFPDTPWKDEDYTINVGTNLEDLAGNNLLRPFDRDLTLPEKKLKLTDGKYVITVHPK